MQANRPISLTSGGFYALLLFAFTGWMFGVVTFGKVTTDKSLEILSEFALEAFKALFIGTAAALGADRFLKIYFGETPEASMKAAGIKHVYLSRQAAAPDILRLVGKTKRLQIVGISLRDFLQEGGGLHDVWAAVCDRLRDEQHVKIALDDRLQVRILLLDPRSSEGVFRHTVEREAIGRAGLPLDVPAGLETVSVIQQNIFGGKSSSPCLQARLYEHCPFAFVVSTDTDVFIQQYDYRDQSKRAALPLLRVEAGTAQYSEIQFSLKTTWQHAGASELDPHDIGTARAVNDSGLKNIFRRENRNLLTARQIEAIRASPAKETIDIMAITGRFYCQFPASESIRESSKGSNSRLVRFAIVNPVSQQAILRTVADNAPPDLIRTELRRWTWERHRLTRLYGDVHQTMRELQIWKDSGCSVDLHLYSSSVACALLLTKDRAFIEQYLYGRSKAFTDGLVLGGEYPVFEYDENHRHRAGDPIEAEILTSTFDIVWKSFSINIDDFNSRSEEEEFEKNLHRLREELAITDPADLQNVAKASA